MLFGCKIYQLERVDSGAFPNIKIVTERCWWPNIKLQRCCETCMSCWCDNGLFCGTKIQQHITYLGFRFRFLAEFPTAIFSCLFVEMKSCCSSSCYQEHSVFSGPWRQGKKPDAPVWSVRAGGLLKSPIPSRSDKDKLVAVSLCVAVAFSVLIASEFFFHK